MAVFGLAEGSKAIRDRLGRSAEYSAFALPLRDVQGAEKHMARRRMGRVLWLASLLLLVAIVVLALLVALGL
jgi:anti-sigma factor RsiW